MRLLVNNARPITRPRIVAWLGYGGGIPFVAFLLLIYLDPGRGTVWHQSLRAYAAVILSFVGALHWGFAMLLGNVATTQRHSLFAWSVIPCLMAFVALVTSSTVSTAVLVIGFFLHFVQDARLAVIAALPGWYLPLRLRLSVVATLSLIAGALAAG